MLSFGLNHNKQGLKMPEYFKTQEETINALMEKALNNGCQRIECPICKGTEFCMLEGYFSTSVWHRISPPPHVNQNLLNLNKSNYCINSVVNTCLNCGFICQHSLSVLTANNKEKQ